ncbi:MAG: hypothetical protein ABIS27_01170 [Longimicrobiales bacterium]
MRDALIVLAVGAFLPASLSAQSAQTGILGDTITVGDVARAAIRVSVPRGAVVVFPDSLLLPRDLENAGTRTIRSDTTATGVEVTAVYSIAAWRPGMHALPEVSFTIDGAPHVAAFDSLRVQSVLPADTTGIKPKPLKGTLGGTRVMWPWLALLVALLTAALAYWLWRRRRRPVAIVPALPARPPREIAMERLERAREAGLVERGELKEFYSEISGAVRDFVEAIDPALSQDLTTSELASRVRGRGAHAEGVELLTLLGAADMVKFARRAPRAAEAYEEWTRATRWVSDATWPPAPRVELERVA